MLRTSIIALFVFAGSASAEDKIPAELDGTYELREFTENGKGSDEKDKMSTVAFQDGLMTIKFKTREDTAKFTLDATKKPAAIDFRSTGADAKTTPGIWKIEKGELTVVFGKKGARPLDFRGTGDGVIKLVMAKVIVPKKDK